MTIKHTKRITTWQDVTNSARTTIGLDNTEKEPSAAWKKTILQAEHSPIRQLIFKWKWEDMKSWVSVHFVRHKIGIEHYVSTQRSDRTGEDRDSKPQSSLVDHECIANAQALITISRKRLCKCASPETREAWSELLKCISDIDPVLFSVCVPECIYRGACPEFKSCGYVNTYGYDQRLKQYRERL